MYFPKLGNFNVTENRLKIFPISYGTKYVLIGTLIYKYSLVRILIKNIKIGFVSKIQTTSLLKYTY